MKQRKNSRRSGRPKLAAEGRRLLDIGKGKAGLNSCTSKDGSVGSSVSSFTWNTEQRDLSLPETVDAGNRGRTDGKIFESGKEAGARIKAEEEVRLKAGKEARLKAVEEARFKAEEEARRKAEEEARLKAEEEAKNNSLVGRLQGAVNNAMYKKKYEDI